jgi:hypothetical protein
MNTEIIIFLILLIIIVAYPYIYSFKQKKIYNEQVFYKSESEKTFT